MVTPFCSISSTQKASTTPPEEQGEPGHQEEEDKKPLAVLSGVSERIGKACDNYTTTWGLS